MEKKLQIFTRNLIISVHNQSKSTYLFRTSCLQKRNQVSTLGQMLTTSLASWLFAFFVTMLLVPSAWAATLSSPAFDASGYEIPLNELNKVKKDRPLKKEIKERRKKRSENTTLRSSIEEIIPPEKADQPSDKIPNIAHTVVTPEQQQKIIPEKPSHRASENLDKPQSVIIHHEPYSYIIAGKRIIIQTVISSTNNTKTVYCRFRSAENGTYVFVPMLQAPDTHYTYMATLPSLAATSLALHYSIVVVDSLGNEVKSQEFTVAVKSSNILPGWQVESSTGIIKVRLENKDKPIEGFSDSITVE